jgi:hypothetical protein
VQTFPADFGPYNSPQQTNITNIHPDSLSQFHKMAIDPETLKQYLADNPPSVVPLAIKPHFEALSDQEKLYAHYISV